MRTTLTIREQALPVRVTVTLACDSRRADVRVELDNQADDFRLQAAFPLPSAGTGRAHMPFALSPRAPVAPEYVTRAVDNRRLLANCVGNPMHYLMQFDLDAGGAALAVMNLGIYEYTWETPNEPRLTLMRATGKIAAELRCHDASGAQCHGTQVFEYAVRVAAAGDDTIMRDAFAYNLPLHATQVFAEPGGNVPALAFSNPWWMPAALKRREDDAGFIVRLWSASGEEQAGTVRVGLPFGAACRARLDEKVEQTMKADGDTITLRTRPFGIVTLRFDDPKS